jgi:hypothetical protein
MSMRLLASRFGRSVFAAALAATSAIAAQAQDRQIGGVGLTVFADAGYRGTSATFRQDTPDLRPLGLNDRVSSLEVGPGEIWEVCEHANYEGRCQVFQGGSVADLRAIGWSDLISSARRVRGGGRGIFSPVRGGLQLYSRTGFAGDQRTITSEIPDLRRLGFNDAAMSLRLSPGTAWEVCVDADYVNCVVVNADWTDLRDVNMRSRISSVRPWRQGGRGTPNPSDDGLVLFAEREYRGRAFQVVGAMTELDGFGNQAESARVNRGRWQLCDRRDFTGRCVVVMADVPDLGSLGLRNAVESARPVGPFVR